MKEIVLNHDDIPLWTGGDGKLRVFVPGLDLKKPLSPAANEVASLDFSLQGTNPILIGTPGGIKLAIRAATSARLTPIWPNSEGDLKQLLREHGLEDFLAANTDQLILALRLGSNASAAVSGAFPYSVLSAKSTVEAGGDVGYSYFRALSASTPALQLITGFFRDLRLPSHISQPLPAGEVIVFQYGGYLKFGADLSVGYEMKGTPKFDLGDLQLSEHFQLSVIGRLGLNASLAGHFAVQARPAADPGWIRVIVQRKHQQELKTAADLAVGADSKLEGLPESSREFLSAALGVHAKNWFNLLDQVRDYANFDSMKQKLDGLALDFLKEYLERVFGALPDDFNAVLQKVNSVVLQYQNLENSAITLFDRYYAKLDVLVAKLSELEQLPSWDKLRGQVDRESWDVLRQLTDGNPLGWITGKVKLPGSDQPVASLDNLKERARKALALIQDKAHTEIREVIRLAKESFPLDRFFRLLATVDTADELKALANDKLGHFIQRLIGQSIEELRSTEQLKNAIRRIQETLKTEATFRDKLYAKFREAAEQSWRLKLYSEYSRADESDALIDVAINLNLPEGQDLMASAGRGDFQDVLASYRPELVRINEGILTHRTTNESAFKVNILGWHYGFNYSGFDRVIVDAEQRIKPETNGVLTVYSNVALTKEKERRRNGERMFTSFLLQFLGEARGILQADPKRSQYLIDIITGMAASYQLSFTDDKTEPDELRNYLSFAKDFGLDKVGGTFEELQPLLSMDDQRKHYGPISAEYEVRYTQAGLEKLFQEDFDEAFVRSVMRKMVLANYFKDSGLQDIGWCYSEAVFRKREEINRSAGQLFSNLPQLHVAHPLSPIPGIEAPSRVDLTSNAQVRVLDTLFSIEDRLIKGMRTLHALIQGGQPIALDRFRKALKEIGDALTVFDNFDEGINTVFALLDRLIDRATPAGQVRASSLKLVSRFQDREVTKMFILQPGVETGIPVARAPDSPSPQSRVATRRVSASPAKARRRKSRKGG